MPVDRPTFSESWYRVIELKPRLRSTVQSYRQHFRGRLYYVLHDPTNNQFFRVDEPGYHLIGMLDGRRTVGEVWAACADHLGDQAPTQPETIELLGQLYTSNLLQADMPGDSTVLFERQRKRIQREVGGYIQNILFLRIPIFDPDRFLNLWVSIFGWAFSWIGFILWLAILIVGFGSLAGHTEQLLDFRRAQDVLNPANLPLLYLCFAGIKALHELGHGFACKKFGIENQSGGAVHTIGIMLLVLMPVPYVDASSSWAFRSKWQRAIVGAAGMYVELAVAAIAALIWTRTDPTSTINQLCYNIIFIASVSTLLFNGNPLIKFDGYFILSDLLEMPNLQQRGKEYLYYAVKKFVYGVRRPRNPSRQSDEVPWLVFYAIASSIYRVFISISILMFISDKLFIVGAIMALIALTGWVFMPLGKFIKYLMTSNELSRRRGRALVTTGLVLGGILTGIGFIPVTEHARTEGVIRAKEESTVFAKSDGFIEAVLDTDVYVKPENDILVRATNPELEVEREVLESEIRMAVTEMRQKMLEEVAVSQGFRERLRVLNNQLERVNELLAGLELTSPTAGQWIAGSDPESGLDLEHIVGSFVKRGTPLGQVVSPENLKIIAATDQYLGPRIRYEVGEGGRVEFRLRGQPDYTFTGRIRKIPPDASTQLPSPALGYPAGGPIAVQAGDQNGTAATEPFWEIEIEPDSQSMSEMDIAMLLDQRVVVRFDLPEKPLAEQWLLKLRQVIQRRFNI